VNGVRAAALLLVGILIGGISGGAAATYLTYRAAESPTQSATPTQSAPPASVGLPVGTAPPASGGTADDAIVAVVQDLLPSVVTVINYAANGQPQSSGSGFVVDAAKGYVITNSHVVEDPRTSAVAGASFDVVFSNNNKVSAKLVGRDQFTDLAVLVVAAQGLKAATLANSDNVPVGALTVAIGSPLGEFQNTVTHGIVSAKGRRVAETSQVILEDLIQTDAPINPGNSGGPLVWAATHQVVGVNTLGVTQATGINFAISSNTVKQIADEIIANGKVVRGYIGIQYSPVTPRQAAQLGLPTGTIGIIVSQVVAGSPAEQAGIQVNDIITKVNDQVIDADHPLSSLLIKNRPGDKVKLTLIRSGKEMAVDVTLGQPPQ
jgi:S1-C subfamily serine protease